MRILIIAPLFPPATGGSATYYGLLVKQICNSDEVESITVLTGMRRRAPVHYREGRISVWRLLPLRRVLSSFWYNALLASNYATLVVLIPLVVCFRRVDVILYHQQTVYRAMEVLGRFAGAPRVLDKRDRGRVPRPRAFDHAICASSNIMELMTDAGVPAGKMTLIPTPLEVPRHASPEDLDRLKDAYRLSSPYILFLGDVVAYKGIFDLLDAFARLSIERSNLSLVIAGKNREGGRFLDRLQGKDHVRYVGEVDHATSLALIQGAELLALPSKTEGLARVALEAIALGRKCAMPSFIPEFRSQIPEFTLSYETAEGLASELRRILSVPYVPEYDLSANSIESAGNATLGVLRAVCCGVRAGRQSSGTVALDNSGSKPVKGSGD